MAPALYPRRLHLQELPVVEEGVHAGRSAHVAALEQNRLRPHMGNVPAGLADRPVIGDPVPHQRFRLRNVGGDDGGDGDEVLPKGIEEGLRGQGVAGAGHHHRVDHQWEAPSGEPLGHCDDYLPRVQHPAFGRRDMNIVEHRVDLGHHRIGRHGVDGGDPLGVLSGDRCYSGRPMHSLGSEGLYVRLDPGPAHRVGASNGQRYEHALVFDWPNKYSPTPSPDYPCHNEIGRINYKYTPPLQKNQ